jgi:hypothetical protein
MKRGACALGFRVHSGWAAMVAVAGTPTEPEVLDRRRIEIADRTMSGPAQPYHRARDLGIAQAEKYLNREQAASRELAIEALRKAMGDLGDRRVVACAVLVSSGRMPGTLEAILRSHPALHTAEGIFFREAIIGAAESCKLPVRRVKEKELLEVAGVQFGMTSVELQERIDAMGKVVSSPWAQDQKYAALAGWLAGCR